MKKCRQKLEVKAKKNEYMKEYRRKKKELYKIALNNIRKKCERER